MSNTKTNGPLFAMFPFSGQISAQRHAAVQLAGREPPDERARRGCSPTSSRSSTTTRTPTPGSCPQTPPIAPPVPQAVTECFAEFLPTTRLRRLRGHERERRSRCTCASPRVTARAATSSADTTLLLANNAGPFLVTSPNTATTWAAGSTKTVTWNVGEHERRAGQHGEREDLAVARRRAHVPVRARREHARTTGRSTVTVPNVVDDEGPRQGRGGRKHLLRHLERELHDHDARRDRARQRRVRRQGRDRSTATTRPPGRTAPANNGSAASVFSNTARAHSASSKVSGNVRSALGPRRASAGGGLVTRRRAGRHDDHEPRHDRGHEDAELAVADDQPAAGCGLLAVQRRDGISGKYDVQRRDGRPHRRAAARP